MFACWRQSPFLVRLCHLISWYVLHMVYLQEQYEKYCWINETYSINGITVTSHIGLTPPPLFTGGKAQGVNYSFEGRTGFGIFRDFLEYLAIYIDYLGIFSCFFFFGGGDF